MTVIVPADAVEVRKLIPGLSAHMPEVVSYSDDRSYDVETYIQIYNCMGFLMQLEIEWIARATDQQRREAGNDD